MIIDTDFAIWYLKKDKKTMEKFEDLIQKGVKIYSTHITVWELFKGAYYSSKQKENLEKVENFLNYIPILPFTREIGNRFASLFVKLEKDGNRIGEMDTLVASITLEYGYPILTRNIKHFDKTNVMIETW